MRVTSLRGAPSKVIPESEHHPKQEPRSMRSILCACDPIRFSCSFITAAVRGFEDRAFSERNFMKLELSWIFSPRSLLPCGLALALASGHYARGAESDARTGHYTGPAITEKKPSKDEKKPK